MSTVEALLDAIRRSPEDRLPRLVLADWLAERGHESDAALLREEALADRDPLELLSPDGWCEAVADVGAIDEHVLEFGGPGSETLTDRGLLRLAAVRAPQLRWLDVSYSAVTDEAVIELARAPGFPRLRVLVLEGVQLGPETWAALERCRFSCLGSMPECAGDPPRSPTGYCVCRECTAELFAEAASPAAAESRPDRDAKGTGRLGRSRRAWWGGFQVTQLQKRRRAGG